ncbi:MAG: YgjP-like metallopeptidase domain-containing protein, partial [Anaerolineaceae bacterium]|nr:YgjP-like metallopeptidase domain-containing protein [Anaerolineaceae bacterium]
MNPPRIDVLIRSPRKTISLIVEEDGKLVVRAPLRMTRKAIEEIVHQKVKWVLAKQVLARTRMDDRRPLEYRQGERFWFLGRQYALALVDSPAEPLRLNGMFYLDRTRLPRAGKIFEGWYLEQARQIIPQRVQLFASQIDHPVQIIRIKDARSRWGSCG